MGEINFLTNNDGDEDTNKKKDSTSKNNDSANTGVVSATQTKDDKDRIKKSREEVLEMIDKKKADKAKELKKETKETKETKVNTDSVQKKEGGSFFSKIFGEHDDKDKKAVTSKPNTEAKAETKVKTKMKPPPTPPLPKQNTSVPVASKPNVPDKKKPIVAPVSTPKTKPSKGDASPKEDNPLTFDTHTWNNSAVLETNLIDKSEYTFVDSEKKFKYIMLGVMAACIVVSALYLVILYGENAEYEKLIVRQKAVTEIGVKVKKSESLIKDAKDFQAKLDTIKYFLDNHIYISNFFDFLEANTLANVFYTEGFDIDQASDNYMFEAITNDLESVRNQVFVLSQNNDIDYLFIDNIEPYEETTIVKSDIENNEKDLVFNDTQLASSTVEVDRGVKFTLEFNLNKDLFKKFLKQEKDTN